MSIKIVQDPKIMGGKPTFAGTRMTVSTVLEYLAEGSDHAAILEDYPELTQEHIWAACKYALTNFPSASQVSFDEAQRADTVSQHGDGLHDTKSKLEEAKDLAELLEMLCKQLIRDERINNFEELHGLAARARSFLKEKSNG